MTLVIFTLMCVVIQCACLFGVVWYGRKVERTLDDCARCLDRLAGGHADQ